MKATIIPITGARSMKETVFKIGSPLMDENPPNAIAAPAKDPIKA